MQTCQSRRGVVQLVELSFVHKLWPSDHGNVAIGFSFFIALFARIAAPLRERCAGFYTANAAAPEPSNRGVPNVRAMFPGRTALRVHEIADKLLCCTENHVVRLITQGELAAYDISSRDIIFSGKRKVPRGTYRVTVEAMQEFLDGRRAA